MRLGSSRGQCTACGDYFSTTANFDRHRIWTCGHDAPGRHRDSCFDGRRCMTPEKMASSGLVRRDPGVWSQPGTGRPIQAARDRSDLIERASA